jgi:transketolase
MAGLRHRLYSCPDTADVTAGHNSTRLRFCPGDTMSTASLSETIAQQDVADLATYLRRASIRSTTAAGSGHPTSAMSAADLTAVLFARHFSYDSEHPDRVDNDRFVLSKGHAAPLLYAVASAFGLIAEGELSELRSSGSPLEGHPVPTVPLVEVATGSLGLGLSNGVGMALGQRMRNVDARTWVMLGDSEVSEGSVWEAMELAGHLELGNLIAVVDLNRLGQRGPTMHGWDPSGHIQRARALGWDALAIDGHDLQAIDAAFEAARESDRPTLIVAKTIKGKGVSFVEDDPGRHGKPFSEDEAERALRDLTEPSMSDWRFSLSPEGPPPEDLPPPARFWERPRFEEDTPTRDAFGAALAARMEVDEQLVVLDAEVSDSTRSAAARDVDGDRFIQAYIAEQNMVGIGAGLQTLGYHPVAATFAAFLTRAHDVIRMAHISRASMTLVGSHAGVSIGEDGPSQMGLDDLAMMRSVEALVLYPCDAASTVALLDVAIEHDGLSYLRTTRGATPLLYGEEVSFRPGGSHVHGASDDDVATIVAAGVTLFEALEASRLLADEGIAVRVVDTYSVDPIDDETLATCLDETGTMIVAEDHRSPGGLGESVAAALAGRPGQFAFCSVAGIPGSAPPGEQRRRAGIDATAIADQVRQRLEDA